MRLKSLASSKWVALLVVCAATSVAREPSDDCLADFSDVRALGTGSRGITEQQEAFLASWLDGVASGTPPSDALAGLSLLRGRIVGACAVRRLLSEDELMSRLTLHQRVRQTADARTAAALARDLRAALVVELDRLSALCARGRARLEVPRLTWEELHDLEDAIVHAARVDRDSGRVEKLRATLEEHDVPRTSTEPDAVTARRASALREDIRSVDGPARESFVRKGRALGLTDDELGLIQPVPAATRGDEAALITTLMTSTSGDELERAANRLAVTATSTASVDRLLESLADMTDPGRRQFLLAALSGGPPAHLEERLGLAITDERNSPEHRASLAKTILSRNPSDRARASLRSVLADRSAPAAVRRAIASRLHGVTTTADRAVVLGVATTADDDTAVRLTCLDRLGVGLNGQEEQAMWSLVNNAGEPTSVRLRALVVLRIGRRSRVGDAAYGRLIMTDTNWELRDHLAREVELLPPGSVSDETRQAVTRFREDGRK